MAEKTLASASGLERVVPGQYVTAKVDRLMITECFPLVYQYLEELGIDKLADPGSVTIAFDHEAPASTFQAATWQARSRELAEKLGISSLFDVGKGIGHQLVVENGLCRPGRLSLATDSHASTYGAVGSAGCGIGFSEGAWVLAVGSLWFRIPETIKVELKGAFLPYVTGKDIALYLASKYGTDFANYKSLEFCGELAASMSIPQRMTISNMGVEMGAKFAFFPSDETTKEFYLERGMEWEFFAADEDASYEKELTVNASEIGPQVALPGDVGNGVDVREARGGSQALGKAAGIKASGPSDKAAGESRVLRRLPAGPARRGYREAVGGGGHRFALWLRTLPGRASRPSGSWRELPVHWKPEFHGQNGQPEGEHLSRISGGGGGSCCLWEN